MFNDGAGYQIFSLVRTALFSQKRKMSWLMLLTWRRQMKRIRPIGKLLSLLIIATINEATDNICVPYIWSFPVFATEVLITRSIDPIPLKRRSENDFREIFDRGILDEIWQDLENFPNAAHKPRWYHQRMLPYRVPSLLALAAAFNVPLPTERLHNVALAFPSMRSNDDSASPFSTVKHWPRMNTAADQRFCAAAIVKRAVDHIKANTTSDYSPSMFELFIAIDFDFVSVGSGAADALYELGYRHSAL